MTHEDYIYNRDRVEEKVKMVKNSLYGYNTPLSEYVYEKNGVLSDEKIGKLANRLTSIMVSYGEDYRYGIGGAYRRCIQLFIYLIIRAYGGRVETFGDIPEVAADMMGSHDSLEEMILYETDWRPGDDVAGDAGIGDKEGDHSEYKRKSSPRYGRGFFEVLDRSYEILAGHRIGDELTQEELQEIWDHYMVSKKGTFKKYDHLYLKDESRDMREYSERQDAIMEYEDRVSRGEVNEDEGVRPPFRILTAKEWEEARLKETEEKEKWKDSLQDPEKFIEAYKEFRSLFFSIGFDHDGLEEAIIHFLCEEGRSGLTDNERFLRVNIQLDKAYRTVERR